MSDGPPSSVSDSFHPKTWRILSALRAGEKLSRNRNFFLFKDPRARRALDLHRLLDSVARDLRRNPETVVVERVNRSTSDGRFSVRIEMPVLHGRRTVYLSPIEFELLSQASPEIVDVLMHRARVEP